MGINELPDLQPQSLIHNQPNGMLYPQPLKCLQRQALTRVVSPTMADVFQGAVDSILWPAF